MSTACGQVMSLALVTMRGATHSKCGAPMREHYGENAHGVLFAPPAQDAPAQD
jgi:hypothetical protein